MHRRDFLLLVNDDFLRKPAQLLVTSIAELGTRHVDRSLVMRDHHGCEISIYIAGRLDVHASHHGVHGYPVLG
jgi:hypothetical protein